MGLPKTIAIDGTAGSGKSTLGSLLADALGYLYLDTGVMYRAVTLAVIKAGLSLDEESAISELARKVRIDVRPPSIDDGRDVDVLLDEEDVTWEIRQDAVNAWVSPVSTQRAVRDAMTEQQRRIAQKNNVVMVGRDIGTVVIPDADLKIYLDASVEVRAHRRYQEMLERGEAPDFNAVLASLKNRDKIDSNREIAPLKPAEDAHIIDSDNLNICQVFKTAMAMIYRV
ncbi:MAG: (d)CMP kinase [Brevefilum sp.]|nr:(d)CMP kinase [Brevefilum sp.]MDT8381120.1 (d)CMP kinase [Brevefilum sp.]MDW7754158.1 (d)CMP kinase [Brevefilum sp.]